MKEPASTGERWLQLKNVLQMVLSDGVLVDITMIG
jgi:hypothetical protein